MTRASLRATLLMGAACVTGMVGLAATAAAEEGAVEKVTVTGSRIPKRDYSSDSPISSVTAAQFSTFGSLTPEGLLSTLPQVVPDASSTSNNPPGGGRATLDLRGLGASRNLVLVNGRRPMPSDSDRSVDVNTIPTALLDRVELITGGASAVYGADAIAGVTNFIMKRNFEGVEVDGGYTISERGDGEEASGQGVIGASSADGKGNVALSLQYGNRRDMNKGARPFSAQATNTTSYFPEGTYRPSATNLPSQLGVDTLFDTYGVAAGAVPQNGGGAGFGFNPDGTLFGSGVAGDPIDIQNYRGDPANIAQAFAPDFYSFNFEPQNRLVLPLERFTAGAFAHYDVGGDIEIYSQATFTNYNSFSSLASSPTPTAINPTQPCAGVAYSVPITNPYLPADLVTLLGTRAGDNACLAGAGANEEFLMRRRFTELGPRVESYENNVWQFMAGVRGSFTDNIEWDVYGSVGRYDQLQIQDGNVNVRKVEELLDAADGGDAICGGFNPFGAQISAECASYINVTAKNTTAEEQHVVEAVISGDSSDLFQLPAGPLGFAVGFFYASDDYGFIPDGILLTADDGSSDVAGFNASDAVAGYIDQYDFYGEVAVPLIADLPWIKELTLTGGGRLSRSNLEGVGTTKSHKVDARWVVSDELRFRGSVQRAVRSPNAGELFSPFLASAEEIPEDPCNFDSDARTVDPDRDVSAGGTGAVRALCLAQGLPGAIIDSFVGPDQINAFLGGNPDLKAETADTYTYGVVIQSPFEGDLFKRFSIAVDYFNISLQDAINNIPTAEVVSRCYNSRYNPGFGTGGTYCGSFNRDAGSGEILRLLNPVKNLSTIELDGWDMQLEWGIPMFDAGTLQTSFVGTYYSSYTQIIAPGDDTQDTNDSVNFAGTGGSQPEFKGSLTFTWMADSFDVGVRTRYIDGMENIAAPEKLDQDPDATGASTTYYVDLVGSLKITDNITVRGGVFNALDQEPRLFQPNNQAGTDPETYDIIGRRYFFGANWRL